MGHFRTLGADDVHDILDAFGAGAYVGHEPLAAGTINTNFRVDSASGRLFLRINEGKLLDDVQREAAIVDYLAASGVPTPAPLPGPAGQPFVVWSGALVSMFPWVEGRVLRRAEITPKHARQVGQALAALHRAGRDFPDRSVGRYEPPEIDRRFAVVAAARDRDLVDAIDLLGAELPALRAERAAPLPEGVIHGDLFVDNVLFDARDSRLVALLDFEQASWGRLAYDLAVATLAFGFGERDFRRDLVRALLDGYTAARVPTAAERDAFPAELRFAAARFAVTRITDVHARRAAGAPPGKDFRRYVTRLRRVKEHCAGKDGLFEL